MTIKSVTIGLLLLTATNVSFAQGTEPAKTEYSVTVNASTNIAMSQLLEFEYTRVVSNLKKYLTVSGLFLGCRFDGEDLKVTREDIPWERTFKGTGEKIFTTILFKWWVSPPKQSTINLNMKCSQPMTIQTFFSYSNGRVIELDQPAAKALAVVNQSILEQNLNLSAVRGSTTLTIQTQIQERPFVFFITDEGIRSLEWNGYVYQCGLDDFLISRKCQKVPVR